MTRGKLAALCFLVSGGWNFVNLLGSSFWVKVNFSTLQLLTQVSKSNPLQTQHSHNITYIISFKIMFLSHKTSELRLSVSKIPELSPKHKSLHTSGAGTQGISLQQAIPDTNTLPDCNLIAVHAVSLIAMHEEAEAGFLLQCDE